MSKSSRWEQVADELIVAALDAATVRGIDDFKRAMGKLRDAGEAYARERMSPSDAADLIRQLRDARKPPPRLRSSRL